MESLSLEVLKKHDTEGTRLVDMVLMGGWLDQMILEVFSNLNDSISVQDFIYQ